MIHIMNFWAGSMMKELEMLVYPAEMLSNDGVEQE